jgi:hypothetical protein
VQAPAQVSTDLGHRQAVQVPQGEGGSVRAGQTGEGSLGGLDVEVLIPGVIDRLTPRVEDGQAVVLPGVAAEVVDQLVTSDPDQPGDGDPGGFGCRAADTAATKVSAVRSSATAALAQRGSR